MGFQWQNPNVGKIHENEDALLSAHIMKDYLDYFQMDYTKSVYTPEAALQHSAFAKEGLTKAQFLKKAGVEAPETGEPIVMQMIRQLKQ